MLRELGTQPNWPSGSSGGPYGGRAGPADGVPGRLSCHEVAEAGRGSPLPQGLGPAGGVPQWGLWRTAGHSLPPVPWAPRSPAGPRLDELEGPAEKAGIQRWPHCLPDDHFGWVFPLMVTHWQLLAWGRGPLQTAEWDWLPGNGVQSTSSQLQPSEGLHLAALCYLPTGRVSIHPCPFEMPQTETRWPQLSALGGLFISCSTVFTGLKNVICEWKPGPSELLPHTTYFFPQHLLKPHLLQTTSIW